MSRFVNGRVAAGAAAVPIVAAANSPTAFGRSARALGRAIEEPSTTRPSSTPPTDARAFPSLVTASSFARAPNLALHASPSRALAARALVERRDARRAHRDAPNARVVVVVGMSTRVVIARRALRIHIRSHIHIRVSAGASIAQIIARHTSRRASRVAV